MITSLHVFDMDGTIVDSSHRYRTQPCGTKIDLQYWIDNECRTCEDTLLPQIEMYRELLADPTAYVVIATARIWCEQTEQFVSMHDIEPDLKIARRDRNDQRGGAALKITGLKRLLNLKQFQNVDEIHVYEDNHQYLKDLCHALPNAQGHYFPSVQGH